MSLAQLESQIDDLRKQAEGIQSRWARTTDQLDADVNLSDAGKRAKLNDEHEQINAKLSDLRRKETELIAAKRQSLERSLFGLTSTDPSQVILYRDSQDRAARLTRADETQELLASAIRSGDKTLAAAVLARAIDNEWSSIIAEYVKQNPSTREQINDLAKLKQYDSFVATLSYATMAPSLRRT